MFFFLSKYALAPIPAAAAALNPAAIGITVPKPLPDCLFGVIGVVDVGTFVYLFPLMISSIDVAALLEFGVTTLLPPVDDEYPLVDDEYPPVPVYPPPV